MMLRWWHTLKDWRLAWVLVVFVCLQSALMALTTPPGYAPDEAAHMAYIKDSAGSRLLLPDYTAGKLPDGRPNYLGHPPLYYASLGLLAKVGRWEGPRAQTAMRLGSATFMMLGLVFAVLAARRIGVGQAYAAMAVLACAAVPMFSYTAGSVSNDTLLYLGVNMMFYGMACRVTPADRPREGLPWLYLGMAIVFLTKATGATFVVFTVLASALMALRRPGEWFRRWIDLRWMGALALVLGGYYVTSLLLYGTPFPKPGELYPDTPMATLLAFPDYAREFAQSMWRRLPVVMSHLSVAPIPAWLNPVFHAMVFLPLVGWLVVRFSPALSTGATEVIRILDAVALGALCTLALHLTLGYQGYLRNGVLGGFQPRYYAYLIPLAWCAFFAICRPGWFRSAVAALFCASAIVVFWASVPFTQLRQQEALLARPQPFAYQAQPDAQVLGVSLRLRGQATGSVDEFSLANGWLHARGWVFDLERRQRVPRLWIHFGPQHVTNVKVQALRPDVVTALGLPQADLSGFSLRFGGLPADLQRCDVVLLAEYADGSFGRLAIPGCPAN